MSANANQRATTKVVSVRVKTDLWSEISRRAKSLNLNKEQVFETALKAYLLIPVTTERNARKESETVFYSSLHSLESKPSEDLQM